MRGQFYVPPDLKPHDVCHELTHAFFEAVCNDAYKRAKWLDEGIASYVAGRYCGGGSPPPHRSPSLAEMTGEAQWHRLSGPRRKQAYQRSWFVVGLLAQRFGESRLVAVLRALEKGSLDAALQRVLGIDVAGVEKMALAAHDNILRARRGGLSFALDTAGAEAWIACREEGDTLEACARESRKTLGGRIAHIAKPTFGDDTEFSAAKISGGAVSTLIERVRKWELADEAKGVQSFLPAEIGGRIRVFWVANGHRWGDAYVRRVRFEKEVKLAEDGEPVILLNALSIAANYGATAAEQARAALGVIKHEIFHVLFARYRRAAAAWKQVPEPGDPVSVLAVQVLNEGVAHLIHRRSIKPGVAILRERIEVAFEALNAEIRRLDSASKAGRAGEISRSAFQGPYWAKFGAISGMAMADAVYRAFGIGAIRDAIERGPAAFARLYGEAATKLPGWPALPPGVRRRF